ncbi:MAG TPA: sulfatase [Planctomycetaceae bacterium]|nr:sulfatase [Planctomycetaceae bacterium]
MGRTSRLLVSLVFLVPVVGTAAERPNVVFFLVDDLGWTDLGCFGSSFYDTPHVDDLAKSGMKFINAYAACPVCSPTRASILTGKYPSRIGITDYINAAGGNQPGKWRRNTKLLPSPYKDRMAHEEVTLAEALKEAGYATFFAGKWHLGPETFWPESQGFDVNQGGITRGGPYGGKRYFSPYANPRLKDGPPGEHLPARLAKETVKFIEANREKPFLAYLSFYSVHTPLIARADLRQKYVAKRKALDASLVAGEFSKREHNRRVRTLQAHAVYAGMVEAMDSAVGTVLAGLKRLGLTENTVVFFMSDNGGLSTSEGHPTSNLPLRGGKGWMYEGGIREPMIVRWPGVTTPGSVCKHVVTSTDFYPTILEILDLKPRPDQHRDGMSFVSLLQGGTRDRGPVLWHYPHYGNQGGAPGGAIRQGRWKLIEWYEDSRLELFDLESDIGEIRDLVDEQPERVRAMRDTLHKMLKETGAVMPARNERYDKTKREGR